MSSVPSVEGVPSVDRAWELWDRAYDAGEVKVLGWADNMVLHGHPPMRFTVTPSPDRTHEDAVVVVAFTVPHPDEMTLAEVVGDDAA